MVMYSQENTFGNYQPSYIYLFKKNRSVNVILLIFHDHPESYISFMNRLLSMKLSFVIAITAFIGKAICKSTLLFEKGKEFKKKTNFCIKDACENRNSLKQTPSTRVPLLGQAHRERPLLSVMHTSP